MTNPRPDLYNPSHRVGLVRFAKDTPLDEYLVECVGDSDQWLEYGIIEHRLMSEHPGIYYEMVWRAGHSSLEMRSGTASNYIGKRLDSLAEGPISTRRRPITTGYWSYLPAVTHAARRPAPPEDHFLSWHDYAVDNGLDPFKWEFTRPRP